MFGFISDKAKALSGAVGDKVGAAKDAVLVHGGNGVSTAVEYLEKNWPKIERVLVDGMLTVAHERIRDDESFIRNVQRAFELLPTPVRLVLPRNLVEQYSLKHRDSIVKKIEEKQAQRQALASSAGESAELPQS